MHEPEIVTTIPLLADATSRSMPSPQLWLRIVAARERTLRARRRRRAFVATSACAIAIACCVAWLVPQQGADPAATALAASQRESQALEAQWRSIALQADPGASALTPLRVVDAALQSAYERHAAQGELGSLWSERNRALRTLLRNRDIGGDHALFAVTRI